MKNKCQLLQKKLESPLRRFIGPFNQPEVVACSPVSVCSISGHIDPSLNKEPNSLLWHCYTLSFRTFTRYLLLAILSYDFVHINFIIAESRMTDLATKIIPIQPPNFAIDIFSTDAFLKRDHWIVAKIALNFNGKWKNRLDVDSFQREPDFRRLNVCNTQMTYLPFIVTFWNVRIKTQWSWNWFYQHNNSVCI